MGSGTAAVIGTIPRCLPVERETSAQPDKTGELFLHVVQVDLQRTHRNLDFPNRHAERPDQQQQRRTEDIGGKEDQADVEKEHRHHAQEQARDTQDLHRTREVQAAAQVVDLRTGDFRGVLQVLFLERANQLGIRKKPVGIGQQDQRKAENSSAGVVSVSSSITGIFYSRKTTQ